MAGFRFEVPRELETKLLKLGDAGDKVIPKMLAAAAAAVAQHLTGTHFGKYVKVAKPKKNKYGWFARVFFDGKTSSGAPAGLAAAVYEFGRQGYHPQPARPEVRRKIENAEADAIDAMQATFDEEAKKL